MLVTGADGRNDDPDDTKLSAAGKMTEALEITERARGHLYSFHQLTGHADLMLDDAVEQLRNAGYPQLAEHITEHLIGRNVLPGRWSFQVVEEYDDGYYLSFKEMEKLVRLRVTAGRRHAYEAAMKERRRNHGLREHVVATPDSLADPTEE